MPTFDGMVAAGGRLYLTTVDGGVLCLGSEGTELAKAPDAKLTPLDIRVKPAPAEPARQASPSRAGEFTRVVRAEITRSDLGYHVVAAGKRVGFVLKRLDAPLRGKVVLKAKLKASADGALKNGFLVFGDGADDARLVKCGLRFAMKKAVVVQGPFNGGKVAQNDFAGDEAKVYDLTVSVDLATGQVTLDTGGTSVTAKLDPLPASITHIGYAALNAAVDFGPIELSAK